MASVVDQQYRDDLQTLYTEYLNAQTTILKTGQEYTIGDRTLERGDLEFIATQMKTLANDMAKFDAGGKVRVKRVVIRHDT